MRVKSRIKAGFAGRIRMSKNLDPIIRETKDLEVREDAGSPDRHGLDHDRAILTGDTRSDVTEGLWNNAARRPANSFIIDTLRLSIGFEGAFPRAQRPNPNSENLSMDKSMNRHSSRDLRTLREFGTSTSLSGSLGRQVRRYSHPRHHQAASRRHVRRRKTGPPSSAPGPAMLTALKFRFGGKA
jgi:hypothetical protein